MHESHLIPGDHIHSAPHQSLHLTARAPNVCFLHYQPFNIRHIKMLEEGKNHRTLTPVCRRVITASARGFRVSMYKQRSRDLLLPRILSSNLPTLLKFLSVISSGKNIASITSPGIFSPLSRNFNNLRKNNPSPMSDPPRKMNGVFFTI